MSAIRVAGLRKRYVDGTRRLDAVAGVDLEVPEGVLWVLEGPSGSGKTTLLGLMGGMVAPTAGEVTVLGDDVTHLRDHHRTRLRRERIGFVFQDLSLIDGMTVLENVTLPLVPLGGARPADRERARKLLARPQSEDQPAHLEEGDAIGDRLAAFEAHRLVERDRTVEIVDAKRNDRDARLHGHSPVHSGLRLSMKAPMPSSASRAIMFSTITREAYS